MTKYEFLTALRCGISGLPAEDIDRSLEYYSEMIDDRIEDGVPEEDAVAAVGTVDENVAHILSDIPLSRIVREKIRPKRTLRGWEIALIAVGSPVWIPLMLALICVALALFVVVWALVITLYAVTLSFGAMTLSGIIGSVQYIFGGNFVGSALFFGAGLTSAGLAILSFIFIVHITRATIKFSKNIVVGLKTHYAGK